MVLNAGKRLHLLGKMAKHAARYLSTSGVMSLQAKSKEGCEQMLSCACSAKMCLFIILNTHYNGLPNQGEHRKVYPSDCQLQVITAIITRQSAAVSPQTPSGKTRRQSRCRRNTPHGSICCIGMPLRHQQQSISSSYM